MHTLPTDFKKALASTPAAKATWELATPLAKNEWTCLPAGRFVGDLWQKSGDVGDSN